MTDVLALDLDSNIDSNMTECSKFLKGIRVYCMMHQFSVHNRGESRLMKLYHLVCQCKDILHATTADIRNRTGITVTLNGPQGHVSAKMVASVEMIEWGLQRFLVNVSEFDCKSTSLLSCLTLDVENCHSTVYIKQAKLSMLE